MRKTHLAIAAVGLSAAAVTGSAVTAENTIHDTVAGYGESAISGAAVTEIDYVTLAGDATYLDRVVFTTTTELDRTAVTGNTATLTLKDGGSPMGSPILCSIAAWTGTTHTISCDTPDTTQFALVDAVGLTVSD